MIIGVPKEIKKNENRVSLTPEGAGILCKRGHRVIIQKSAGQESGYSDELYQKYGGEITDTIEQGYKESDIIIKVKEPIEHEYKLIRNRQIIFTFLHLASNRLLAQVLLEKKATAIAYESVQLDDNTLPLLFPMSQIAGRLSVQIGAGLLCKYNGGSGILMGGVPGVEPAKTVIIGAGTVGFGAIRMAVGLGSNVTVLDISSSALNKIDDLYHGRVNTVFSNEYEIANHVMEADLLIGAVLIPNAKAPRIVTEEMVKTMKKGSVIVDVAIDQGGIVETADHVTYHDDPTYIRHGIVHYSVANMPGSVPKTATKALTAATLPYIIQLADKGEEAFRYNKALERGLNTYEGKITCRPVALSLGMGNDE